MVRALLLASIAHETLASPTVLGAQGVTSDAAKPATKNETSLAPGNHTFTLQFGAKTREYIIHVPGGAPSALPLLLAFHGGGGEAAGFQKYAGLDAVSDREKFLVVFPYGTGILPRRLLTWNAGECCGPAMNNKVDDVGFAIAVIDDVIRRTHVDAKRIYATGHSNGAMMAYRPAGEHAERIAAIAPVSGSYDLDKFAPSQPVAVLDIHSVDDPRALYNGGMGPAFPGTQVKSSHQPVMESIHRWTVNNKCKGDSSVRYFSCACNARPLSTFVGFPPSTAATPFTNTKRMPVAINVGLMYVD